MRRAVPALLAFVALLIGTGPLAGRGASGFDAQVQGPPRPPPPPPPTTGPTPNPSATPPAEAGTGAISGVIVDGTTNAPLADAVVYLGPPGHGPPNAPLRMITDEKGRFVFRDLPAFDGYFINVSRTGYFEGHFGRGSSGALGGRIALSAGEWFRDANVRLYRPAAITGVVIDDHNEPVVGAFVRVLTSMLVGGTNQIVAGPVTVTDDRGVYRLYGLEPGRYLVQIPSVQMSIPASSVRRADPRTAAAQAGQPIARDAMTQVGDDMLLLGKYATPLPSRDGRPMAYPPLFYSATRDVAAATWIALKYGDEKTGIDFRLEPVPTYRVSGTIEGPPTTTQNLTVRLMIPDTEDLGPGSEVATALTAPDGRFTFLNVPAGRYVLVADRTTSQFQLTATTPTRVLPGPPLTDGGSRSNFAPVMSGPAGLRIATRTTTGDAWWGRASVDVASQDVTGLRIVLRKTATLTGRVVWAEAESGSWPTGALSLEAANGRASLGIIRPSTAGPGSPATDRFTFEGLMPGQYLLRGTGIRIKSISYAGDDYTSRPFDASSGTDITDVVVTLTSKSIVLTGTARDARNQPSNEMAVIVFPIDRELWSLQGFSADRVKAIQTNNAGGFRFQSLPAGEYYIVAVDVERIDDWKDPDFLVRVTPLASRLSLTWGQNVTQDLRMVTIR